MSANSKIKAKYIMTTLNGVYVDPPKLKGITIKKINIYDHHKFVSGYLLNRDIRIFDHIIVYKGGAWTSGQRKINVDNRFTFGDIGSLEEKGFIFNKDSAYIGLINTAVLGELGS